jgi:SAM-dependent methyltransferase
MRAPAPDREVNYRNFGYYPLGRWLPDAYHWAFGVPNLGGRLQAGDIIRAMGLTGREDVLDFGSGNGYITVELAKQAGHVTGLDIAPPPAAKLPPDLASKVTFVQSRGEHMPFDEASFDVVLASEILPMIDDPGQFLTELKRVMRPGGRLIVVVGLGHPAVEAAYRRRGRLFTALLRRTGMPDSYEGFRALLSNRFATATLFSADDVVTLVERSGFRVTTVDFSPHQAGGAFVSWLTFFNVARGGSGITTRFFPLKMLFGAALNRLNRRPYRGGLICVATRDVAG